MTRMHFISTNSFLCILFMMGTVWAQMGIEEYSTFNAAKNRGKYLAKYDSCAWVATDFALAQKVLKCAPVEHYPEVSKRAIVLKDFIGFNKPHLDSIRMPQNFYVLSERDTTYAYFWPATVSVQNHCKLSIHNTTIRSYFNANNQSKCKLQSFNHSGGKA